MSEEWIEWGNPRWQRLLLWGLQIASPSPSLGRVPTLREAWTGRIGAPPPQTTGCHRGHRVVFVGDPAHEDGGVWTYDSDGMPVPNDPERACGFCQLPNREDGHDACLGELPGVMNACCGHGAAGDAYVQFSRRRAVYRAEAVETIARMKGLRP